MRVLALIHAHLKTEGLSPVSCERADSIVHSWAGELKWRVDVIHTAGTKWKGIWPGGSGINANVITVTAPGELMLDVQPVFAGQLKRKISDRKFLSAASLIVKRIGKRIRRALAAYGIVTPYELNVAAKWGNRLYNDPEIKKDDYDFIFTCVGYGDEYLMQTALTLSRHMKIPVVTDFRDLWSEHHEPDRFTTAQRRQIRKYEKKLLANTILISVPQKHMKVLLEKWTNIPVYYLSHSAHVEDKWHDGKVSAKEFKMVYAGKLYYGSPGPEMLMQTIKRLASAGIQKPFKCYFFVDDTEKLKQMVHAYDIADHVQVKGWVSPGDLWQELRSAHLMIILDSNIAEDFPLVPTKAFQYAHAGGQIMALFRYQNQALQDFFEEYKAGKVFLSVDDAVEWVKQLSLNAQQYESLHPLRDVPLRKNIAIAFGNKIKETLNIVTA